MITARAMKRFFFAAGLGAALGGDMAAAQASVVEWHLQNVRFDDGGTATGFISVDVDHDGHGPTPGSLPELVDWDIRVSGGNTTKAPPFEYTPASTFFAYISASIGAFEIDTVSLATDQRGLGLNMHPLMTNTGGTVFLVSANSPSREAFGKPGILEPITYIREVSGELTAVPEPCEAPFLALGVAALLAFSGRRSRRPDRSPDRA